MNISHLLIERRQLIDNNLKCHTSTGQMPQARRVNAPLGEASAVAFGEMKCGIWGGELWHLVWKGTAFQTVNRGVWKDMFAKKTEREENYYIVEM